MPPVNPRLVSLRRIVRGRSLRSTRSATGTREPLSQTTIRRKGRVCAAIESRSSSRALPPSRSRTIASTSLMFDPVEDGGSPDDPQLDVGPGYRRADGDEVRARRNDYAPAVDLERRAPFRRGMEDRVARAQPEP